MPDNTTRPDDSAILKALYNNCDPLLPATEAFYVDCTEVRGSNRFATRLCQELADTTKRQKVLFTGHIGCGKSSELEHLAKELNKTSPKPGQKRFFTVVVKILDYVNQNDTQVSDILLALVTELADALRKNEEIELEANRLVSLVKEFRDFMFGEAKVEEINVNLGLVSTKIKEIRMDEKARADVRKAVAPRMTSLVEAINELFQEARVKLTAKNPRSGGAKYSDFVLVIDDLEKILRVETKDTQGESLKKLFIENAPELTGLDAHVVYTIPLSLVRSVAGVLTELYGKPPFVLPMVKVEERPKAEEYNAPIHPPYEPGIEKMKELIGKRLPKGVALESVIVEDGLMFLIKYSGGHIRNLMRFTQNAVIEHEGGLPITLKEAQRAIRDTIGFMSPMLRPGDWQIFATLETDEGEAWDNNDPDRRRLLENICVMEYINGGEDDLFNEPAPWYAVNPLIRELRPFQRAVNAVLAEQNSDDTN